MNIKQRAQELLTCDELRGRLPEEVRKFLSDVVALEPVSAQFAATDASNAWFNFLNQQHLENTAKHGQYVIRYLYDIGAPNDPA